MARYWPSLEPSFVNHQVGSSAFFGGRRRRDRDVAMEKAIASESEGSERTPSEPRERIAGNKSPEHTSRPSLLIRKRQQQHLQATLTRRQFAGGGGDSNRFFHHDHEQIEQGKSCLS